jgi:hypothetical protein
MRYPGHAAPAPVSGLADLLIGVLERGIVIALRLDGPPGDRRLLVGFGTPEAIDPIMLALGVTSRVFDSRYDSDGWME